jgi:hypothetical protein
MTYRHQATGSVTHTHNKHRTQTTVMISKYHPGDAVYTSYGAGVIVAPCNEDGLYSVRLWRIPGKSVGSSSLAKLRLSAVRLTFEYSICIDSFALNVVLDQSF